MRNLARAYSLQQDARASIYTADDNKVETNFTLAVKAFEECSRYDEAASCYHVKKIFCTSIFTRLVNII